MIKTVILLVHNISFILDKLRNYVCCITHYLDGLIIVSETPLICLIHFKNKQKKIYSYKIHSSKTNNNATFAKNININ